MDKTYSQVSMHCIYVFNQIGAQLVQKELTSIQLIPWHKPEGIDRHSGCLNTM
jgi:hypothetical protein